MNWTVRVAKQALKSAGKFPARDQEKIATAVAAMAIDPFAGDVIKLEGSSHRYRRRVGNYRIFFAIDVKARTVEVSAIVRRTTTTY